MAVARLHWQTFRRPTGTKDATISRFQLQQRFTALVFMEKTHAFVGMTSLSESRTRTSNSGEQLDRRILRAITFAPSEAGLGLRRCDALRQRYCRKAGR
jgi:hypothetical protein